MTALQTYYVTFGVQYSHEPHPYWAGAHPDGWLTVLAPDEEAARLRVRMFIGLKWSMMYDSARFDEAENQRTYYPRGELARISTDGDDHRGVGAPTRQFGPSSPEYYGRESNEVIAVRIEGQLAGENYESEHKDYDVEYFHPRCWIEGVQMFKNVTDLDRRVMAFELDWADPHNCPICDTSIT